MSRKQFDREMAAGFPSPAYYLYAGDPFLLKDALEGLRSLVPPERRDFDLLLYDADTAVPPQEIRDALNTPGFFGGRKVVVLRNTHQLKKKEAAVLLDYLSSPSSGSLFVMLSLKPPDKGMKEGLKGRAKVLSLDMRGPETREWVRELGRQRGVELTPDAVSLLVASCGTDLGVLQGEVEKASLLGKAKIDAGDICGMMHGAAPYTVFSLVDALVRGDRVKVFEIYGAVGSSVDPFAMLGALNWKYSELSRKAGPARAGYFEKVFRLLTETDMRLKTSGGDYPLEELFVALLRV